MINTIASNLDCAQFESNDRTGRDVSQHFSSAFEQALRAPAGLKIDHPPATDRCISKDAVIAVEQFMAFPTLEMLLIRRHQAEKTKGQDVRTVPEVSASDAGFNLL
ncbi:hypothetical protein ACI2KR_08945 [Pseudomonas luteola]